MSANEWESTNINFGGTYKCEQVGEFTDAESMNNEDQLGQLED